MEMFEIQHPFSYKISRHSVITETQAEYICHLGREYGERNTAGESDDHRIGDEFYDGSKFAQT